ncbi:MAG: hypothetical protein ACI4S0_12500 [Dorea sp.]
MMKSSKPKKDTKSRNIGVSVPQKMFNDIEQIANEQGVSKSAFIRRCMYIILNYNINSPEFSLVFTELCRCLESSKESMDPQTYQELSASLEDLIRLISNPS